jgi:uncharacterized caspase-like protein
MRRLTLFGLLLAFVCALPAFAAERRVALVIGNGAYTGTGALKNTVNDANAVGAALEGLGFEVSVATDMDRRAAIEAIDDFSRRLRGADAAFLFYAGHGMQIAGQNFLLPVDVDITSERALRYSAIDIGEVVADMEANARVALVVLDACRDNPFLEALVREAPADRAATAMQGLSPMQLSGRGAIVAYAAAAGKVASDGAGPHSPYTEALLAEIAAPGVEVGLMFRRVAGRVFDGTRGSQRPELLVRLVDEHYLNPAAPAAALAVPAVTQPVATVAPAPVLLAEADAGVAVRSAKREGFFGNRVIRKPDWADNAPKPVARTVERPAAIAADEGASNDTAATAVPLPLGAVIDMRILPRGDRDWFAFDAPSAGLLTLRSEGAPEPVDLAARLLNANMEVVRDWQWAPRPGGVLDFVAEIPRPGRYLLDVADNYSDAESPQPFRLVTAFEPVMDPLEPNETIGTAAPVRLPAAFRPAMFPLRDADWMSFWIPQPGLLTLSATNVPQNIDIAMRLLSPDGAVFRDWQVPPRVGGDTVLEAEIAIPGVYVAEVVENYNDASSPIPFDFTAEFRAVGDETEPNESFAEATAVQRSGGHRLAMFPRGDVDWLSIDVDHPGELKLLATHSPADLDLHLRVFDANKDVVRDWVAPMRKGGDNEAFVDLPRAGRYFVEISDGYNDASSADLFDFELEFTPQPDQYEPNNGISAATPLTPGGEVLFNILPMRDVDWFRVDVAEQGELAVTIDEGPEELDLVFRVWNANLQVVRDWVMPYRKGGLTEGIADLPAAGTYYIEVADNYSDARSIDHATLRTVFTPTGDALEPNDSFGTAKAIVPGTALLASMLPLRDVDWLLVDAPRAGEVTVLVEDVPPELDIAVRLWNADAQAGNWIVPLRPGGVTDAVFPVPSAGIYRVEIRDSYDDARSPKPFKVTVDFR